MRTRLRARQLRVILTLTLGIAPLIGAAAFVATKSKPSSALSTPVVGLSVAGNHLVDAGGNTVVLRGVNRSGTEYGCIQGWGIFDGPSDAASVQAIAAWHANAVRVPLNEDCWLGINGVATNLGGSAYRQAIANYVSLLNQNGLYAILELHWSAPGSSAATGQNPMPDQDHSPAFWTSVANTFKANKAVVFDLFNEPYPDNNQDTTAAWTCWKNGGTCSNVSYPVAGMQSLVDAVRATGATNVIMVGGVQYAGTLSHWGAYAPTDPAGQLAASFHTYNFTSCTTTSCWNSWLAAIGNVPLVTGEIGETDGASSYIDPFMSWADAHGVSYLAWVWDTWGCGGSIALITDYSGTPCAGYGTSYKNHLAAMASTAPTTTAPTTTAPTTTAPTTTTTAKPVTTTTTVPTTTTTMATTTTTLPPTTTTTPPPTTTTTPPQGTSSTTVALDAVVNGQVGASGPLVSPPLSTWRSGELLVAFISTDGPGQAGAQTISGVSGGGLTWTRVVAGNAEPGASEIWTAFSQGRVKRLRVTATRSVGGYGGSITLAAFTGASGSVGAVSAASGYSGAPSLSLIARSSGSVVWGVGQDWDSATSVERGPGQVIVNQSMDTAVGNTSWVQRVSQPTSAGATVVVSDIHPTNDSWNLAAVEIRGV